MEKETHLEAQLTYDKIEELYQELAVNKELEKFLTTKAKDLPVEYKNFVSEITDDKEITLLKLIETGFEYSYSRNIKNYFFKEDDKIMEFAACFYYGNEVTDIIMFSFYPDRSSEDKMRDFKELIINLSNKYERIFWKTSEINPDNVIFQKINEEFGGEKPEEFYYESDHEKRVKYLRYCIGTKKH